MWKSQYFMSILFIIWFIVGQKNQIKTINSNLNWFNNFQPEFDELDSTPYKYSWLNNYNFNHSIINVINVPIGYKRVIPKTNSFEAWLQNLPLKINDNTVYLYDGNKKRNQQAQYKVVNIDVGNKDLQQCADAVIRLRAEYLFTNKQFEKIKFNYTNGISIPFSKWSSGYSPSLKGNKVVWVLSNNNTSYESFKKYMNNIFTYAGTLSLSKELRSVELKNIQVGDVLIKGGSPGHAVIVVDVSVNDITGDKCFMLAQSYMPAQSIHIIKNPANKNLSPWYSVSSSVNQIVTPEWTFEIDQLKRFE